MPETEGLPIRYEQAGQKPADVPGHVWVDEKNPYAGNCEAQWHWVLYKRAMESDDLSSCPVEDGSLDHEGRLIDNSSDGEK